MPIPSSTSHGPRRVAHASTIWQPGVTILQNKIGQVRPSRSVNLGELSALFLARLAAEYQVAEARARWSEQRRGKERAGQSHSYLNCFTVGKLDSLSYEISYREDDSAHDRAR